MRLWPRGRKERAERAEAGHGKDGDEDEDPGGPDSERRRALLQRAQELV